MAWPVTQTGRIDELWEPLGGGYARLRVNWQTDGADAARWLKRPLVGVLHRVVGHVWDGLAIYGAHLYSRSGWDVLNGLCSNLAGTGTEKPLYRLLDGSDRPRPIVALGPHMLHIDASSTLAGVFDLYYYTDLAVALEQRLVR